MPNLGLAAASPASLDLQIGASSIGNACLATGTANELSVVPTSTEAPVPPNPATVALGALGTVDVNALVTPVESVTVAAPVVSTVVDSAVGSVATASPPPGDPPAKDDSQHKSKGQQPAQGVVPTGESAPTVIQSVPIPPANGTGTIGGALAASIPVAPTISLGALGSMPIDAATTGTNGTGVGSTEATGGVIRSTSTTVLKGSLAQTVLNDVPLLPTQSLPSTKQALPIVPLSSLGQSPLIQNGTVDSNTTVVASPPTLLGGTIAEQLTGVPALPGSNKALPVVPYLAPPTITANGQLDTIAPVAAPTPTLLGGATASEQLTGIPALPGSNKALQVVSYLAPPTITANGQLDTTTPVTASTPTLLGGTAAAEQWTGVPDAPASNKTLPVVSYLAPPTITANGQVDTIAPVAAPTPMLLGGTMAAEQWTGVPDAPASNKTLPVVSYLAPPTITANGQLDTIAPVAAPTPTLLGGTMAAEQWTGVPDAPASNKTLPVVSYLAPPTITANGQLDTIAPVAAPTPMLLGGTAAAEQWTGVPAVPGADQSLPLVAYIVPPSTNENGKLDTNLPVVASAAGQSIFTAPNNNLLSPIHTSASAGLPLEPPELAALQPPPAVPGTGLGGIWRSYAKAGSDQPLQLADLTAYPRVAGVSRYAPRVTEWLVEAKLQSRPQTSGTFAANALAQILARQSTADGIVLANAPVGRSIAPQVSTVEDFRVVVSRNPSSGNIAVDTIHNQTWVPGAVSSANSTVTELRGVLVGADSRSGTATPLPAGGLVSALTGTVRTDVGGDANAPPRLVGSFTDSRDEGQVASLRPAGSTIAWAEPETPGAEGKAVRISDVGPRVGIPGRGPNTSDADDEKSEELIDDKRRGGITGGGKSDPNNSNDPQNTNGTAADPDDDKHGAKGKPIQGQQGGTSNDEDGIDQGQLGALIKELRGRDPEVEPDPIGDRKGDVGQGVLERRRRYQIKKGDTLENIAQKELGSRKAAALILQINRRILKLDADGNVILPVGFWITLPSQAECLRFLVMREVQEQAKLLFHSDSEQSNKVDYCCRLGDTLTSIARRHCDLGDERLWVLLARANNLTEKTDKSGHPLAHLKRGQVLKIPDREQVKAFLQTAESTAAPGQNVGSDAGVIVVAPVAKPFDVGAPCPHPSSWQTEDRSGRPQISDVNTLIDDDGPRARRKREEKSESADVAQSEAQPITEHTAAQSEERTTFSPPSAQTQGAAHQPEQAAPGRLSSRLVVPPSSVYVQPPAGLSGHHPLAADSGVEAGAALPAPHAQQMCMPPTRVVTQANLGDETDDLDLSLQVNLGDRWLPIVQYRVRDRHSSVCVFTQSGKQRTILIDLPVRAARELAENDLTAHSSAYCVAYLADRMPF